MWKQQLYAYFSFTKKERMGTFVLLTLIFIFILLPFFYPLFFKEKKIDTATFEKEIATLKIKQQDSAKQFAQQNNFDENNYRSSENNYYTNTNKGELFYFDPNTATTADWKRLGVNEKTSNTIKKYVSKGGHFYKPNDIGKIWGLHPNEVQRLLPYIKIETTPNNYQTKTYTTKTYDKPKYLPLTIDINNADTTAFIALPGIGSKLANRIINFRNKLGGFYKIEQIAETFALPDSTFQKIKPRLTINNTAIKKININTATLDELKQHPYIRYNIANAIIQYRNQHGNFLANTDLKKIMLITDEVYNKIAPYIVIQ